MNTHTLPHYPIKKITIAVLTALLVMSHSTILRAEDQGAPTPPPPSDSTPQEGKVGKGGKGGPGGGLHLLPPRMAEQLNLSDDQKKQISALELEMKTQLEKILQPDQLDKLKQGRPGRGGGKGGKHGGGTEAPQQPPATPSTSPAP